VIASVGVQLYRDADAMFARGAATFQRAAAPVDPAAETVSDPADLAGAAVDVLTAGTLGRLGVALIGRERDLTQSLVDILA
jgi:hypothetical protein